jgi:hypothetical protein
MEGAERSERSAEHAVAIAAFAVAYKEGKRAPCCWRYSMQSVWRHCGVVVGLGDWGSLTSDAELPRDRGMRRCYVQVDPLPVARGLHLAVHVHEFYCLLALWLLARCCSEGLPNNGALSLIRSAAAEQKASRAEVDMHQGVYL